MSCERKSARAYGEDFPTVKHRHMGKDTFSAGHCYDAILQTQNKLGWSQNW